MFRAIKRLLGIDSWVVFYWCEDTLKVTIPMSKASAEKLSRRFGGMFGEV